ncbi:hypothetical protein INT45_007971 [Circinella minor]|uniref:Uncharacterized protein n=1 Tax=Circinella minor TaxID=1195481 RepID=A0A8H7S3M3_9FUNG|nr:hypothetical protein INT45_007971 [Circinella minor]
MGCCVTKSRLPHPMLNHHFDTITTMWYGRHLSVHGTKEVNDKFIHYQAAECSVPLFPGKYPQLAKLFEVVLSLKRSIIKTQAMHDVLVKTTFELFLDSDDIGSRSPVHVADKEDSFELGDETIAEMASLLSQPEEEQFKKFNEALTDFRESYVGEPLANQEELKSMYSTKPTLDDLSTLLDQYTYEY